MVGTVCVCETSKIILLAICLGTWISVMNGKPQRSSLSKILWVFNKLLFVIGLLYRLVVLLYYYLLYYITISLTLYYPTFRAICVIGLRMQTVVTSTAWSTKLERELPFLTMTRRTQSQLKREPWVKCRANWGFLSNVIQVYWLACWLITRLSLGAALDRNLCALVSERHLPGHLPPTWHCIVGWREVQTDSEVQPSGCVSHRLLAMWEVTNVAVSQLYLTVI